MLSEKNAARLTPAAGCWWWYLDNNGGRVAAG
jgi:hypothetical protein